MFFKHQNANFHYFLNSAVAQCCWISRSHRGISQRDVALLAWEQDQQRRRLCGGCTAPAASMITPRRPRAVTLCDFVIVRKKRWIPTAYVSNTIIKMCLDPGPVSPPSPGADGMWCVTVMIRLTSFMSSYMPFTPLLLPNWPGFFHSLESVSKEMFPPTCLHAHINAPTPPHSPSSFLGDTLAHTHICHLHSDCRDIGLWREIFTTDGWAIFGLARTENRVAGEEEERKVESVGEELKIPWRERLRWTCRQAGTEWRTQWSHYFNYIRVVEWAVTVKAERGRLQPPYSCNIIDIDRSRCIFVQYLS